MPFASWRRRISAAASGRSRSSWRWTATVAVVPPIAAFLIQLYLIRPTMARWAMFYPAVFVASWLGGLPSGLVATALAAALVPVFYLTSGRTNFTSPANLYAAIIFVVMGIAISIVHERLRKLVAQLEQSRRLLEAIMDNSENVIVIKDLSGRYMRVNRSLEEMLEIERGEAVGKTDAALFSAEAAEEHHRTDAAVFTKRSGIAYEETLTLNGRRRVFQASKFPLHDADGQPFAICAIWSDITDRKRIEEALRQSESDLREAQRIAHLGSWTYTVADDATRWSDEVYRIVGREPPPVPGGPVEAGNRPFSDETRASIRDTLRKVLKDGQPQEAELEVVRPDGTIRWVAARGDAVRNEKGEIVAVAGTVQDITQLKELQRVRDEWTSLIAHDLRQPIGVISMAASALPELHAESRGEQEQEFVARISSAAEGLARLVDDLLDLSLLAARRLTLERVWVGAGALVNATIESLAHVTKGRRVVVTEGQGIGEVCVDQTRIAQVLGNLISNAVKYGDADSEIGVGVEQRDGEVEITVTNRGPGIPREELPRLFGRFRRTAMARHSGKPGIGVGLYITKELTEAHGGRIWVESTPGETTTFHVALPSRDAARQAA